VDEAPSTPATRLLVVIPAWNEAASIGSVVAAVRRELPEAVTLVVNDGSTDDTSAEARRAGARVMDLPDNLGIGGAVQAGYLYAVREGFEVVARIDGDGQHPPSEILKVLAPVLEGRADLAIGSRFLEAGDYRPSRARRAGIRLFAWLLSRICGQRLTDTTSGFRVSGRLATAHMADRLPCDYPEVESLISLRRAGYTLCEVPVEMADRAEGISSIGWTRAVYYVLKVLLAVAVDLCAKPHGSREEMARRFASESKKASEDASC